MSSGEDKKMEGGSRDRSVHLTFKVVQYLLVSENALHFLGSKHLFILSLLFGTSLSSLPLPTTYPVFKDSFLPVMKPALILPVKCVILLFHWFIQQIRIESLLHDRHCSRHQGLNGRQDGQTQSCLHRAYISHGET